jgi:hypothetical protein
MFAKAWNIAGGVIAAALLALVIRDDRKQGIDER